MFDKDALELKTPKTVKGKQTLEKVLKAAEIKFDELGYHQATIEDIVGEANVSIGTFYVYFDSKKSLYRYLVLDYYHRIRKYIAEKTITCQTRQEQERVGLKAFLKYIIKHPYMYTIIWQSLVVDRELFIYYYSNFADKYRISLDKATKRKQIREKLDTETLSYALVGIANFIGLEITVLSNKTYTEKELDHKVNSVVDLLQNGMF